MTVDDLIAAWSQRRQPRTVAMPSPPASTTVFAATGRDFSLPVGFCGAIRRRIALLRRVSKCDKREIQDHLSPDIDSIFSLAS
jgi:hypothetical protein